MAAQRSNSIEDFPLDLRKTIELDGEPMVCIDGLYQEFQDCYTLGMLPAAHGKSTWAKAGAVIALDPQHTFEPRPRALAGLAQ